MFDRQVQPHAGLLDQIGRQYFKHIVGIVTIDTSAIGWASGGSSGGESGRFDYEGNGLIILPTWMRANDLKISAASGTGQHGVGEGPRLYVFPNTKDNPGIPMGVNSESQFGAFCSLCCSFKRFYVYVGRQQTFGSVPFVIQLAVLKGLDLYGCGSQFKSSGADIIGCYNAGDTSYV